MKAFSDGAGAALEDCPYPGAGDDRRAQAKIPPPVPNLRGTKRCVNPKCNRRIYSDYVKLSSDELGHIILCAECWSMPIDDLPEAAHVVFAAATLSKTYGPPPKAVSGWNDER